MALPKTVVYEWRQKSYLTIEGYRSASLKQKTAEIFAMQGINNSDQQEVILKMLIENKKGKHYICLDRPEYTLYLDEYEVLIQAGLRAKVLSIEESDSDD